MRLIEVGGIPMTAATRAELAAYLVEQCRINLSQDKHAEPRLAIGANGQTVSLFSSHDSYREMVEQADLLYADGMSLVTASRLFTRHPLPERIATTDFFHDVAKAAIPAGLRFYFLGADEEISHRTWLRVRELYPTLQLAGRRNGYYDQADEDGIVKEIVRTCPDILWVGLGSPRQESFCIRRRADLRGISWMMTCGGLFDFLAGKNSRAPQWMQNWGLEWAYRTILEPRRLLWRYLTTNPHAMWRMALHTRELSEESEKSR